jgi:hypothetical protein
MSTAVSQTPRPAEVRLSIAIMHHPSRRDAVGAIVAGCSPLTATIIEDPDPDGIPSPLRTAKLAWAAIEQGATHHLVLQDDVELPAGFIALLLQAIAGRPSDAIALSVNWNSPCNAYLSRLAAVAGSPWADLSDREWVPTLGLVLPAPEAAQLAVYLERFPEDVADDDEIIAEFCRSRRLPISATIPNLVNHGSSRSVAGNDDHGDRQSVIPFDTDVAGRMHWSDDALLNGLRSRRGAMVKDFSVVLLNSLCSIRLLPGLDESLHSGYTWGWRDAAPVVHADTDELSASLARYLQDADTRAALQQDGGIARLASEVWAAAYLLGWDAASVHPPSRDRSGEQVALDRLAVGSWVDSGLSAHDDRRLGPAARRVLVDCGIAAVAAGFRGHHAPPAASDVGASRDGFGPQLRRMARREAEGLAAVLRIHRGGERPGPAEIALVAERCPWCGCEPESIQEFVDSQPLRKVRRAGQVTDVGDQAAIVGLLACEWLSPRVFAIAAGLWENSTAEVIRLRTRALAYVQAGYPLDPTTAELNDALDSLNALEHRQLGADASDDEPMVLPAASYALARTGCPPVLCDDQVQTTLWPAPLGPHLYHAHLSRQYAAEKVRVLRRLIAERHAAQSSA